MNPIPEILPREILDAHLREVLGQLSLGLERTANFGTHIMQWFADVHSPEKHRIVFIMLLRQYLELLDAVSILVRQSSIDPCKLVLRSMFEVFLSLQYMLQEDTKNRAGAYVVTYIERVLKAYREADPSTPEGQERRRRLNANQSFPVPEFPIDPAWASNVQMLQAELASEEYELARKEYEKLRAHRIANPRWYSLFGGPSTIEQLAGRVKLSALYESHYRSWSQPLHGTDIFANKLFPDALGNTNVVQLRFVGDAQSVCADAFTMSAHLFRSFVSSLLPQHEEETQAWYRTIHEYGVRVNGPPFINVTVKPTASGS